MVLNQQLQTMLSQLGLRILAGWGGLLSAQSQEGPQIHFKSPIDRCFRDSNMSLTMLRAKFSLAVSFLGDDIPHVLPCIPKSISITAPIALYCHYLLYCSTQTTAFCLFLFVPPIPSKFTRK